MNWILIAISFGMIMTSSHESEEACLGRKAMLEKDKIYNSKCVDMKPAYVVGVSSGTTIIPLNK